MFYPFPSFLPDLAAFRTAVSTLARNVIPAQRGYRPFSGFAPLTSALTARAQGAVSVRQQNGTIHNFCGDATKLYKLSSDGLTWDDVSRTSGGAYNTASDGGWTFQIFGDIVMATNGVDVPQSYLLGTSTDFAALAGSPPNGAYCAIVRDFAILAKMDTAYSRLQWSAINDIEDWTPSATTMADYNDFPDGGAIMGIIGGDYGLVFMERNIQRMAFEGPPLIFRFDKISQNLGCRAPGSIAAYENLAFFLSHDGFYMIRSGAEIVPIGTEKIDKWFGDQVDDSYIFRINSAIDPTNKLYLVGFPSTDASSGTPDTILIYHWPTGQWSYASVTHEMIYTAAAQSTVTWDGLDAFASTLDALPYPIDSLAYAGAGTLLLSGFDTSHKQGFFSGAALEAAIETGDLQFAQGRKSMFRAARPLIEGTSATPTLTVGYRDQLQTAVSYDSAVTANSNGVCPVRRNARYHRARVTIPAGSDWTYATGIDDVKFSAMGAR